MPTISNRGVAIALTAFAVGSAAVALMVSVSHQPVAGVAVSGEPVRVTWVLPGGPAWNDGIRQSQTVREIEHGDHGAQWRLVVVGADGIDYASTGDSHRAGLRATASIAGGSLLLAALAVLASRRKRWQMAGALASLAIVLASWPIFLTAQPLISEVAAMVGMLVPVIWMVSRMGISWASAATMSAVPLVGATWLVARVARPELYPLAELGRVAVIGVATGGLVAELLAWQSPWARTKPVLDTSRSAELAGMAAAAGAAVLIAVLVDFPIWVAGGIGAAAAMGYPPLRRHTAGVLDRLLLSGQREHARIAAVEQERLRLASDIHDVPLQEIAGVIRRLERVEGTDAEADLLRGVAQHLRDITAELHPPVLKDLGLAPALRAAAEDAHRLRPPTVQCELHDITGVLPGDRPPGSVELAVFRIIQEALVNARLHAEATRLTVAGQVSPDRIAVSVRDDGVGLDPAALRAAQRAGHFGVTSMGQRADAIGAELRIEVADPGTLVSVAWSRE